MNDDQPDNLISTEKLSNVQKCSHLKRRGKNRFGTVRPTQLDKPDILLQADENNKNNNKARLHLSVKEVINFHDLDIPDIIQTDKNENISPKLLGKLSNKKVVVENNYNARISSGSLLVHSRLKSKESKALEDVKEIVKEVDSSKSSIENNNEIKKEDVKKENKELTNLKESDNKGSSKKIKNKERDNDINNKNNKEEEIKIEKEDENLKVIEKQKENEKQEEAQNLKELEKQKESEKEKEIEKQKEIEKNKEIEKQKELEQKKEMEKQKELEQEKEMEKQKETKKMKP